MAQFRPAASTVFAVIFYLVAFVSSDSYQYQNDLSNIFSPFEPRPLSPPALTYIPAIGLGTWLSKAEDVCLPIRTRSGRGTDSNRRLQMRLNGLLTQDTATSMQQLSMVVVPVPPSPAAIVLTNATRKREICRPRSRRFRPSAQLNVDHVEAVEQCPSSHRRQTGT
jgi:hypothetical protein